MRENGIVKLSRATLNNSVIESPMVFSHAAMIIDEKNPSLEFECWQQVNQVVIAAKTVCGCYTHTGGRYSHVKCDSSWWDGVAVSCRQSQPYRQRYLRSLDPHTWKGRSTCELSDLPVSALRTTTDWWMAERAICYLAQCWWSFFMPVIVLVMLRLYLCVYVSYSGKLSRGRNLCAKFLPGGVWSPRWSWRSNTTWSKLSLSPHNFMLMTSWGNRAHCRLGADQVTQIVVETSSDCENFWSTRLQSQQLQMDPRS